MYCTPKVRQKKSNFWDQYKQCFFFVEIAKNLSFLFADNIRSFIFGMIESMPRSRPVIIATYRMLEHYAITFWKNTWSNSTQNGMRKSDN